MPTDAFTFTHEGETHTLPPASDSSRKVPGWVIQDALMNPSSYPDQMRLALYALEASDADPAAREALREMPGDEMLEVIESWMGESSRSSRSSASTGEQSSTTVEAD